MILIDIEFSLSLFTQSVSFDTSMVVFEETARRRGSEDFLEIFIDVLEFDSFDLFQRNFICRTRPFSWPSRERKRERSPLRGSLAPAGLNHRDCIQPVAFVSLDCFVIQMRNESVSTTSGEKNKQGTPWSFGLKRHYRVEANRVHVEKRMKRNHNYSFGTRHQLIDKF